MKKNIILGLVVVGSLLVAPFAHDKEKEVVVATAGDIRLFSFKKTTWESIFVGLDSGHYQVAANNLSYTKERADKYLFRR